MDNIAIIEYKEDIGQAVKYFPLKKTLFLSVSGEASYYLLKRNINFLTDEDLLSADEFKRLGYENFGITEKWVQQLEELLQTMHPQLKQKGFCPFRWHFYRLKILVDAVKIRRVLLERLIKRENPSLIGLPHAANPGKIHDHNLFFNRYDCLYGLLGESEKDFRDKIRKVLERGVVISNVEDTSFLERYGIYKDDGRSSKRMIDNIEDILNGRVNKYF